MNITILFILCNYFHSVERILINSYTRYNSFRYDRADELVWIKTNQLQRLIRTGRTGHWLNHSKEHCLVGIKGNPEGLNWGLDCDVLVGEVRFVYIIINWVSICCL